MTGGGLVPGDFLPPPSTPAPSAASIPPGGWLHASADPVVTVAALGGGGEKFIEIALPASVSSTPGATLVARVVDLPLPSPERVLMELEMIGCSTPSDMQCLGPIFMGDQAGAVAHLATRSGCLMAAGPRTVLHFEDFRLRRASS